MLGFMVPTCFLSMWISNTATTAMMVPIVEAVLTELNKEENLETIKEPTPVPDGASHCHLQLCLHAASGYSS